MSTPNSFNSKLTKIFKISILLLNSKNKRLWNYNEYLAGYKHLNLKSVGIISLHKNILSILKLIGLIKNLTHIGCKFLFVDDNIMTSGVVYSSVKKINQYFIGKPLNISGSLSNFTHMRWYFIKNNNITFPYRKPDCVFFLEALAPSFPIIKEANKLGIPAISVVNFNNLTVNKKFLYPMLFSNFNYNSKKLFYFEILSYLINLCRVSNYANYLYDINREDGSFLRSEYLSLIYGRYPLYEYKSDINPGFLEIPNILYTSKSINKVNKKLLGFTLFRRRVRLQKIQMYDYNRNKKWQWYKKKKFKYVSLYLKTFINKGKFKAPFSKFKLRYMLLKQIFCNLFDLQYNYKTWWREVIKKGLYSKIKKFSKNFKTVENFLLSSERYFIFLLKKHFGHHSFKNLTAKIKNGFFLLNGSIKHNPYYLVRNNSILQKKLFNNNSEVVFNFFGNSKLKLGFMWRQYFFRNLYRRRQDYRIDLFNKYGVPLIDPARVDRLGNRRIIPIFIRKVEFWFKFGSLLSTWRYRKTARKYLQYNALYNIYKKRAEKKKKTCKP